MEEKEWNNSPNGTAATVTKSTNDVKRLASEEKDKKLTVGKESLADVGVLCCVFFSNLMSCLDFAGIGVLYLYLVEHFEASTVAVGWCASINGFAQAIVALFASYPIEFYGCRRPAVIGSLVACIGTSLSYFAHSLAVIYITYGVVAGCGTGLNLLSSRVIVIQRFSSNRNLASGITFIGFSVGSILGPIVTNLTVQFYGWRGAFLLLGAFQAQRIPLCLFFRTPKNFTLKHNDQSSESERKTTTCISATGKYLRETFSIRLLLEPKFAVFSAVHASQMFGFVGFVTHTVNRAVKVGLTRGQAVTASSLTFVICLASRIIVSFVVNIPKVDPCLVYAVGMYLGTLAVLCIFAMPEVAATMTSVVFFGFHQGCTTTITTVVVVSLMGVKFLPRCQAILLFIGGVAKLAGPTCIGWIYDVTLNYNTAFIVIGCTTFVAGNVMILLILVTRWKKRTASPDASQDGLN